jgi:hypothetical protein
MDCASCSAPLEDALILACDHNLCLHCASRDAQGSDAIVCRVCGRTTTIDPESSQQLKFVAPSPALLNRPLRDFGGSSQQGLLAQRSVAETHVETPNRRSSPLGTSCGQCEAQASLRCLQCQEELCSSCATAFHRKGRLAFHTILPLKTSATVPTRPAVHVPIAQSASGITRQCPEHPDEQVQYFCLACETKPVCAECVFRGAGAERHHAHLSQVVLAKKAFLAVKSKAEETTTALEAASRELGSRRRTLEESKTQLREVCEAAKAQMRRGFAEIAERLKSKEAELCKRVDELYGAEFEKTMAEVDIAANKITTVDSLNQKIIDGVSLHDEVATLTAYAEAKENLREPLPALIPPNITISPEASLIHADHVNAIHNAITAMAGLVPSIRAVEGFPKSRSLARVLQTSVVAPAGNDEFLMHAVSQAFANDILSPQARKSPRPYKL